MDPVDLRQLCQLCPSMVVDVQLFPGQSSFAQKAVVLPKKRCGEALWEELQAVF